MYERLNEVYKKNKIDNKNIVAIDASITHNEKNVNAIVINKSRGVKPGAGIGKLFPEVGDKSILMYTLHKEDLNPTIESYRTGEGKKFDKSDLHLIEEVYNEACNINII